MEIIRDIQKRLKDGNGKNSVGLEYYKQVVEVYVI